MADKYKHKPLLYRIKRGISPSINRMKFNAFYVILGFSIILSMRAIPQNIMLSSRYDDIVFFSAIALIFSPILKLVIQIFNTVKKEYMRK